MTRLMALVFAVVLGAVIGASAHAGSPEINVDNPQKVAVHGFDIMSYWRDGEPKEGHTDISFDYRGAKWLFSSTDNRDAFAANPDKFAPKYGGYCAYAASRGYVANIDVSACRSHAARYLRPLLRHVDRDLHGALPEPVTRTADAMGRRLQNCLDQFMF